MLDYFSNKKSFFGDNTMVKIIKKKRTLTEDEVSSIHFFEEDLTALDEEIERSDKLYDEIHSLYANLTSGEYVPNKNLRDIAEMGKNMVSARSYHSDTLNKRIQLKKLIADLNFRNNGGVDENSQEAIQATARQIVALVRQDPSLAHKQSNRQIDKRTVEGKNRIKEESELDKTIEKRMNSGQLVMGMNDKLVGTNEYVVIRYNKNTKEFIAVDSRNGSIIENFPKDRLPKDKINKFGSDSVTLMSGDEIKAYDNLEFDDEYVDEGD